MLKDPSAKVTDPLDAVFSAELKTIAKAMESKGTSAEDAEMKAMVSAKYPQFAQLVAKM